MDWPGRQPYAPITLRDDTGNLLCTLWSSGFGTFIPRNIDEQVRSGLSGNDIGQLSPLVSETATNVAIELPESIQLKSVRIVDVWISQSTCSVSLIVSEKYQN